MDPHTAEVAKQAFELEVVELAKTKQKAVRANESVEATAPFRYRLFGRPIQLTLIEFRIISFLSAKPYKAYTRSQIVHVVADENNPVTEATLDEHIRSLRNKLGIFSDYIQSVPYVGYRFKL
ncbi:MAG: helix-turn-helix domain-containing protein [Planctomycetales bacterium]|nr:helix-turn-helix domain-containing protein [Planctomycetales bacterium]